MRNSPDPSEHRIRERQFMEHVQRLLSDERLRLDTTRGRRPAVALMPQSSSGDRGVELKRMMAEMGKPDRELEQKMPTGQTLTVELTQTKWFFLKQQVGRMQAVCVSPTLTLLEGGSPAPLDAAAVNKVLTELDQQANKDGKKGKGPTTVVLMSTSGFTLEAHALATRGAERTLVMVEPNDAGGWTVTSPAETRDLSEVFDPEGADAKRRRLREFLDANSVEMTMGGLATDRVAAKTQLPLQIVESELKSYARENPGLVAKLIDGRLVLYREGSALSAEPTGADMPFWEKVKGIFVKTESREKKIGRLASEKAALVQQRDRAYDEIAAVEKKEQELTGTFKDATALAQRRIATEIAQLRKGIERRQQVLSTIDKKINIVETGIHNLEMEQQLNPEKLQQLEEAAQASEHVDIGMATLDQLNEQADSVSVAGTEMSMGAADVMAELQAKFAKEEKETTTATAEPTKNPAAPERTGSERLSREPATPVKNERRGQAEPG